MKKRKGAASFYIVIFSTLLLTVISVAFITAVMNDANRTVDADLSQSAYDSALAGIEDAKIAIARYQSCMQEEDPSKVVLSQKDDLRCSDVIELMNRHAGDCDVVGRILGRISKGDTTPNKEVYIQEIQQSDGTNSNNMEQAYTCVTLSNDLKDYRATLNSEDITHVIPIRVKEDVNSANSIRVSWYSDTDGTTYNYRDKNTINNGDTASTYVQFPALTQSQVSVPPTIAVGLIQTGPTFSMSDLDMGGNRGKLFLVPTNVQTKEYKESDTKKYGYKKITLENGNQKITGASNSDADYFDITGTFEDGVNIIKEGSDEMNFTKSNNNYAKNVPVLVYCPQNTGNEFACSVSIQLPKPYKSEKRNPDTFMIYLSLPYGRPDTDFSIEVCTDDVCKPLDFASNIDDKTHLTFKDAQFSIDSTGRANDLFRRVEVRAERYDPNFPVPTYAVQLDGKESSMTKNIISDFTSQYYRNTDEWDGK